MSTMRLRLERRFRFCAGHIYRRPEWTEEENRRRFGKCAIEPGHGHNYRLTVAVGGIPDPQTGFLVDLPELDRWVEETVVEPLDHRHINHAVEEFAPGRLIPSSENLVSWMLGRLETSKPEGITVLHLRLEEDDDLAAEWRLEDQR